MKISNFGSKSWVRCLPAAVYAVNISVNRSIGTSPYMFSKGKMPIFKCDVVNGIKVPTVNLRKLVANRDKLRIKYDEEIIKGKKEVHMIWKIELLL